MHHGVRTGRIHVLHGYHAVRINVRGREGEQSLPLRIIEPYEYARCLPLVKDFKLGQGFESSS
jgi:hypothetical protein